MLRLQDDYQVIGDMLLSENPKELFDFEKCHTVLNPLEGVTEYDAAAALIVARGNVAEAARLLQRTRSVLAQFIRTTSRLEFLMDDMTQTRLDYIEDNVFREAEAGCMATSKFLLTTRGKERGYTPRVEQTGAPEAPHADTEGARQKLSDLLKGKILGAPRNQGPTQAA